MANITAEVMKQHPPGVMLYFDLKNQVPFYNDEELGKLLRAVLEYGETGVLPDFSDRGMIIIWANIQEKIDRDRVLYWERIEDRKYASYCRYAKKKGEEILLREEWDEMNSRSEKQNLTRDYREDAAVRREATSNNW